MMMFTYNYAVVNSNVQDLQGSNEKVSGTVQLHLVHASVTVTAFDQEEGRRTIAERLKREYPDARITSIMCVSGPLY